MSGGAGGGRWAGGPAVTSGEAKETRRRLGTGGKTLSERHDGWRETDPLAAFGGQRILWCMARFETVCGNNFDLGPLLDFEKM
jgi:hypothetical protein